MQRNIFVISAMVALPNAMLEEYPDCNIITVLQDPQQYLKFHACSEHVQEAIDIIEACFALHYKDGDIFYFAGFAPWAVAIVGYLWYSREGNNKILVVAEPFAATTYVEYEVKLPE